jgi:hypothetical protein
MRLRAIAFSTRNMWGLCTLACIQPSCRDKGLPALLAEAAKDLPPIYFEPVLIASGNGAFWQPAWATVLPLSHGLEVLAVRLDFITLASSSLL